MRFHSILLRASCAAILALTLAGCGTNVKKQLGLERPAPDEFAVVRHAPLAMPPDYTLRAPRPGAPRPQEEPTDAQAEGVVFGADNTTTASTGSSGADEILQQAGADIARPQIRQIVDSETSATPERKTAAQKLGLAKPSPAPATVVDAKKEAERLKQNQAAGKPVTAGTTPSVGN